MELDNKKRENIEWLKNINIEWSLFLDRDGVINDEIENGYILNWEMFHFLDGVLEALAKLSSRFSKIFIVTNQKGVGKGLMSLNDLEHIHHCMLKEIQKNGGRIDKIYFCTDVLDDSPFRKPNIGMANLAKHDYPNLDFSRSIMVGNTLSDMEFGEKAGMKNIFIKSKKVITDLSYNRIDAIFSGLADLAKAL